MSLEPPHFWWRSLREVAAALLVALSPVGRASLFEKGRAGSLPWLSGDDDDVVAKRRATRLSGGARLFWRRSLRWEAARGLSQGGSWRSLSRMALSP